MRSPHIRILAIGDIVGSPARDFIRRRLADYIRDQAVDFVVANGENSAAGSGIVPDQVRELTQAGIDVLTTGDHIWKRAQIVPYLRGDVPVLRPANYPPSAAGRGWNVFRTRGGLLVGVINLIGRIYLEPADCPFRTADAAIAELAAQTKIILVDMHAEATSEKIAMGWYLDGRVTAVLGTHTHVQTADERILPKGTAYITDLGMTGPYDSVIGRTTDSVLQRFLTSMFHKFEVAEGDVRLSGVLIEADPDSGRATAIQRVVLRPDPA